VRLLAQTVHPRVLDDLGLAAALRKLARDASRGSGIDVDVTAPRETNALPYGAAAVLYRVAQEAVRNAIRHADPRRIRLTVTVDPSMARLEVLDDGQGFDVRAHEKQPRGTGLVSIRDRLALVDGTLDVRSATGGGTTIIASIPLSPVSKSND
ncbi:MAG TPA: ATP-binding protein, partial [Gemmatimonadaceae bacterium]